MSDILVKPNNALRSDQDYEARGIIAKMGTVGNINAGTLIIPIPEYISLDAGEGRPAFLVKFSRMAPIERDEADQPFLDMTKLKEGDIVITPGLLYRRVPWTGPTMSAHLVALKKYRRKTIVTSEVDRSQPATEMIIDPNKLSTK